MPRHGRHRRSRHARYAAEATDCMDLHAETGAGAAPEAAPNREASREGPEARTSHSSSRRHTREPRASSREPRTDREARPGHEPRSASGERTRPTGNLGATVKAWLGVIDEVLRTVETTAYQARNVAEQARGAYLKTRESVDELEDLLRDAAARATR